MPRFSWVLVQTLLCAALFVCWVLIPEHVTRCTSHIRSVVKSEGVDTAVGVPLRRLFAAVGVPPPYPSTTSMIVALCATASTAIITALWFRSPSRRDLEKDLQATRDRIELLMEKLEEVDLHRPQASAKPVRVFMDGAFDMMHYGHANAFRQSAALFPNTILIVGVNSSETITTCKGKPIMSDKERCIAVEGCKFVSQVIPETPYVMTREYIDWLIEEYKIDYFVHGDDPVIVDGQDIYGGVKERGMYRSIPRTEGVSSSDIVGRMLLVSKGHHNQSSGVTSSSLLGNLSEEEKKCIEKAFASRFFSTASLLRIFSRGCRRKEPNENVVYLDGAWDMFHSGHIEMIREARKLVENPFIVVGVHNDKMVNRHRGFNFPILNMQERILSVLSCKYVDDIVIDAPWIMSETLISSLDIKAVVHGTSRDPWSMDPREECFKVPRAMGIFHQVQSKSILSVGEIMRRILSEEERYHEKFLRKMKMEQEYYDQRYGASIE